MALVPMCVNCTKYKPLNNRKGTCTQTEHGNKAITKERKRNEKCINAQYFVSKQVKKMKYYSEPNTHIIDYEKQKEVFCFNEKGEFETTDEKIILFMKKKKNFIRCEESQKIKIEIKILKCKKCEFTCENQGDLMQHYKKIHPKKQVIINELQWYRNIQYVDRYY